MPVNAGAIAPPRLLLLPDAFATFFKMIFRALRDAERAMLRLPCQDCCRAARRCHDDAMPTAKRSFTRRPDARRAARDY